VSLVVLVPMKALMSAPMMVAVFFLGIWFRNSEKSRVVFSMSSSEYPEWGA
jgi:hypothetical protein